jgi:threonine/homoserine/homoserine lactone efflux protein
MRSRLCLLLPAAILPLIPSRRLPWNRRLKARSRDLLDAIDDANHHAGMVRMAESPAQGVVDRGLKVFGTNNLDVAGAAVFPNTGAAKLTPTAIARGLRLARNLSAGAWQRRLSGEVQPNSAVGLSHSWRRFRMADLTAFVLAVLTLLAVPGPTNTLLATSGATVGVRRSLRIMPGEIGGYLVAITVLTQLARPLLEHYPLIPLVARIIAALYLVWSAIQLWRNPPSPADGRGGAITISRVFLTTLANPKALIFAFVIFPMGDFPDYVRHAAVFAVLVIACGFAWINLGAAVARSSRGFATSAGFARVAAVALCFFAVTIAGSAAAPLVGWAPVPGLPIAQTVR